MNTIEPISGIWTNGTGDTAEKIPVAILQAIDSSKVLCVRGDTGDLTVISLDRIKTDWRFDAAVGRWMDISVPEEGEDVGDETDVQG